MLITIPVSKPQNIILEACPSDTALHPGGVEAGSKPSGDPSSIGHTSTAAGAKDEATPGAERHHVAAKALTNTKVRS